MILFNPHKSLDILPKIKVNGAVLEVVEEVKLLGIMITSDLKWKSNTKNLVTRANTRLWMLRRLARLGTPEVELIDTYCKQIRSVLELAVPVWHPGLTLQESNDIETVQKSSFHIILGKDYLSYNNALNVLQMESLMGRRKTICLKFGLKTAKNPKFENWFCKNKNVKKREAKNTELYKPPWTRTQSRYRKSPLPYLTNLLNRHDEQSKKK